jgi:hypothetical protein
MVRRTVAETRRSTLYAALGFYQLPDSRAFPEVAALKRWLSTWSGIGHVVVGMERQGFVVSLRRLVDDGWTASFHSHAMLAATGSGRHRRRSRRCRWQRGGR